MQLGSLQLEKPVILAPMAGVSDAPFRTACLSQGADLAVHEMVSAKSDLRESTKSSQRLRGNPAESFRWVQIVGADPDTIASGAILNVNEGADAIDINMGCPAKKVCKKAAGSALLADPGLVESILIQTVESVDKPVTLKIRTGIDPDHKNALQIAKIAERSGIQCLTIHGRTRADRFTGKAEYNTIRDVRQAVDIAIIANGDVTSPEEAEQVLHFTGADGLMIGRAAYGNPWLFAEIKYWLAHGKTMPAISEEQKVQNILTHINHIHLHYGDYVGVRIARKHIGWYLETLGIAEARKSLVRLESAFEQQQQLTGILSDFALPKAS